MRPRERFPHDDPRERMNRAHSNPARAKLWVEGVYLEDLCFDAQQAAEKAGKALLPARRVRLPFIHNLSALLSLVEEAGVDVPTDVFDAAILTRYAAVTRYPAHTKAVTNEDHRQAVELAGRGVRWAEGKL